MLFTFKDNPYDNLRMSMCLSVCLFVRFFKALSIVWFYYQVYLWILYDQANVLKILRKWLQQKNILTWNICRTKSLSFWTDVCPNTCHSEHLSFRTLVIPNTCHSEHLSIRTLTMPLPLGSNAGASVGCRRHPKSK